MKRAVFLPWGENGQERVLQTFSRLGVQVDQVSATTADILEAPALRAELSALLKAGRAQGRPHAFVFSHDFFPAASEICAEEGVPYISLVYDSPHYALYSPTVRNAVNHIWLFDRGLLEELAASGATGLHHTLLPVDPAMAERTGDLSALPYEHDICFLGSLYQNSYASYEKIRYLPPALKNFLDTAIEAQQRFFDHDLLGDPAFVPDRRIEEMSRYVDFALTGDYRLEPGLLLRDMLKTRVTALERSAILAQLAERFPVDVYTSPDSVTPAGVRNLGYADYATQMPRIFNRSRINLNITLRTIRTGIPLRAMDIMACGGFLLSDYREELAEFFVEGEDMALARTPGEFAEKAAYYLEHEREREEIARNGQRKVLAHYTSDRLFSHYIEESLR